MSYTVREIDKEEFDSVEGVSVATGSKKPSVIEVSKEEFDAYEDIIEQAPSEPPPRPIMVDSRTPLEKARSRLGESAQQRLQQAADIAMQSGPFSQGLSPSEQAFGLAGTAAGFGWDAAGEIFNMSADGWSYIIPDDMEEGAKEIVRNGMRAFTETKLGQNAQEALMKGEEAWFEFKDGNPDFALLIESFFNIGPWFRRGPSAKPITKTGDERPNPISFDPATRQLNRLSKRQRGIWQVIAPPKTSEQINRQTTTPQGIGRTQQTVLTPSEIRQIQTVAKHTRVDPTRTDRLNAEDISQAVSTLEERLIKILQAQDTQISHSLLIESARAGLEAYAKANPGLGDMSKQMQRALNQLRSTLQGRGSSAVDILKARRDLDSWRKDKFGSDDLKIREGSAKANARKASYDIIRRVMNQTLDVEAFEVISESAVKTNAKKLLREQSDLLSALDVINAKYPEGSTIMARVRQNVAALDMTLPTTPLAQMATVNAAANTKLLPFIGGGLATIFGLKAAKYGFSKAYYNKEMRLTVETINKAIKKASDPEMVKQLRLDRAAVIELYKGYIEDAERRPTEREASEERRDNVPTTSILAL